MKQWLKVIFLKYTNAKFNFYKYIWYKYKILIKYLFLQIKYLPIPSILLKKRASCGFIPGYRILRDVGC